MTLLFLRWLTDMARNTAADDEPAGRNLPTTLEQRIAVGLVQARALECRELANQLLVAGLTRMPHFHMMYAKLLDKSSEYERMGLKMCETWPPMPEEPQPRKLVELAQR